MLLLLLLKFHTEHKTAKAKKLHMMTQDCILRCAKDTICFLLEIDPL
jgi:hypothetical protein